MTVGPISDARRAEIARMLGADLTVAPDYVLRAEGLARDAADARDALDRTKAALDRARAELAALRAFRRAALVTIAGLSVALIALALA